MIFCGLTKKEWEISVKIQFKIIFFRNKRIYKINKFEIITDPIKDFYESSFSLYEIIRIS